MHQRAEAFGQRDPTGADLFSGEYEYMDLYEVRARIAPDSFARLLGIEVLEASPTRAVAELPLEKQFFNAHGSAHGGLIFSLADMAFAALVVANDLTCVNAQTSISYVKAGRKGPLRAEARMLNSGRKLVTCEVSVLDADDELLALATVTGYVMTPRPAA